MFDLSPYSIQPYWVEPNVFPALISQGFYQGAFHQLLYGFPTADSPALPPGLTIRAVQPEDADTFAQVYDEVWGGSGAVRVLIGHPRFRCYLAFVDETPAALGILHGGWGRVDGQWADHPCLPRAWVPDRAALPAYR